MTSISQRLLVGCVYCALFLTMWMMLPVRGRVCTRISLMVIFPQEKQKLGSSPNPGLIRDTNHLGPGMVLP